MNKGRSCSCLAVLVLVFLAVIAGALFYLVYPILFGSGLDPEDTEWPADLAKIDRADWAEAAIANPDNISPMGEINKITIHHDGLPPLPMVTEKQIKKRVVAIRDEHSRKYADIGYHYIVGPRGRIWEARPIQFQGAHAQGHNANNIGILFLGNTSNTKPTKAGVEGLFTFLGYLQQRYEIPVEQIYTHAELGKTECPGKHLQAILDKARKDGTLDSHGTEQSFDWQFVKDRFRELPEELKKMIE